VEEIEPGIGGPSGLERMVFFSDAVFAIVITLLVLPITAEVELDEAGGGIAHQVWALWPRILSFLISFLVIGQFWIAHHRMFGLIRRIDRPMLGINLVGLLTITFLPLPTAILGADTPPGDAFPAVFYAISLSAASFMLAVTWGSSLREIAAALTAEGHPTKRGGTWQANTVRRILSPGRASPRPETSQTALSGPVPPTW
jgi:uncharacterized membrane protein